MMLKFIAKKVKFCGLILSLLLLPFFTKANKDGSSFVKSYSEKDYSAHAENHYIAQDQMGIIFFANSDCVLSFDGINWENIYLPNIAPVFAVSVDEKGSVFVAGRNELGYLKYNHQGKFVYESLIKLLSEKQSKFSDIYDIVCNDGLIYFLAEERLFIYNQKDIKCIEPSKNGVFRALFKVNNKVYVNDKNTGLQLVNGYELSQVKNSNHLGELRIKSIFDVQGKLIVCTGQNKFIDLSQNTDLPWFDLPENNELIVRTAIKLRNGNICVGSKNNGLIIFNQKGEILAKYNVKNGLINNSIWYLYEDLQSNIWVATDKGISFIELSSNIEKIKSEFLSQVNLNSLVYYKKDIYISTSQSILKLSNSNSKFSVTKITDEPEPFHQLLLFSNDKGEEQLLAASDHGIIQITQNGNTYIDNDGDFPVNILSVSKFDKTILFAGGVGQLFIYRYSQHQWKKIAVFDIAGHNVISFVEPQRGIIWAGTIGNNYFKLNSSNKHFEELNIIKSKLNLKKQNNTATHFFYLKNNICVDTDNGLFTYKNNAWSKLKNIEGFPKDTTFKIIKTFETKAHRLWVSAVNDADYINCGSFTFKDDQSNLIWADKFLKRFYNIQINSICEIENELWLASNEGLFYTDLNFQKQTGNFEFNTLIKSIQVPSSKLYFQSQNWQNKPNKTVPEIQYKNNQIRFEYTAANFVESEKIKFSSMLMPFDKEYSKWSFERIREFTNLTEGSYTFKVKSMDIYGNIGEEDEFSFTILPPWYRTWWAYTLFAGLSILLVIAIIKFNTRRLKKQNQLLEATVINRTQEIAEQKNKIEEINREVTDSIRYAQMIQNSILPLATDLKKAVPSSFIFYKPRDIVSGDFYWIHEMQEENKLFVAAADCTGHGVPGAFMSMMGMEKLNQSVKVIQKVNPSAILSYLNKEIKLTLGKHINERELRDGMEIALIEIDLKNNLITYAGANRPMWIVSPQKEAEEIEVYKPTKAGIAGFTEFDQLFEQNTIQWQKGQTVYLFTDGAIDQFGGEAGKKIMTKGLKKLINDIQSMPLDQQHQHVANFFEEWQGAHEQVDDILIIGLRLEA